MIDLRRNVIFGQYLDRDSPVQRLDPRVKILVTGLLTVTAFLVAGGWGFVLLLPLVIAATICARVPLGAIIGGSRFFLAALAVILAFTVLFDVGGSILVRVGPVSVTTGGLRAAGILAARVLLLYWSTTVLMLTTQLVDLTDGIERLFAPLQRMRIPVNELVLVGVIALKFVPIFTAEAERLMRARAARGMPVFAGGLLVRARRLGTLLVPIFVSGFRRADVLATAMDARCYRGGRNRTRWRSRRVGGRDWAVLILVLMWCGVAVLPGRL